MSASIRSLLSVRQSMTTATEGGKMASTVTGSSAAPEADTPWPRAMADSMLAFGTPAFFAALIANARRALVLGSGP